MNGRYTTPYLAKKGECGFSITAPFRCLGRSYFVSGFGLLLKNMSDFKQLIFFKKIIFDKIILS